MPSLSSGDPKLDDLIEIRAFEPERARALVDSEVRAALGRLLKLGADVEITDLWVRVRLHRPPSSEVALGGLVDALRHTVLALETSRVAIGPSPALATRADVWTEAAEQLGLALDPAYPALAGTRADRPVRVVATRTQDGFSADVEVRLAAHVPTGLTISMRDRASATSHVGQDITLGDPSLDAAFVIQGWDPGAIRHKLDAAARAALTELHGNGEVEASDRALVVRGVALDAARLVSCVRTAESLAAALGW